MDYYIKKLDQKIKINECINNQSEVITLYQAKIEYNLLFTLSILWNQDFQELTIEDKEYAIRKIERPSIGEIVELVKFLDKDKKLGSKRIKKILNKYPNVRNEYIGHGFTFNDKKQELLDKLVELDTGLNNSLSLYLESYYDYILPVKFEDGIFYGLNYKSDITEIIPWQCDSNIANFELNSTYVLTEANDYIKLSPFISITPQEQLFIFSKITERLLGTVQYNSLLTSEKLKKSWNYLSDMINIEQDERIKCLNKTIVNAFNNNYTNYIDIGVKESVKDFLIKNRSSVACTVWGHGGVGKTAVVQRIIEELKNDKEKVFEYIVFLSAKDRFYNYKIGKIEEIKDRIDSFSDIIKKINIILGEEINFTEENIINTQSKLLIVIDDLETFTKVEAQKIKDFSRKLDINNHKLILTTRANLIIGEEIKTNEFDLDQTGRFLKTIIKDELKRGVPINHLSDDVIEKVYNLTSGRPLFLYQFAYLLAQRGLRYTLMFSIKDSSEAINFLYGRIFEYLDFTAKKIFIAIGQLINDEDRSGTKDILRFSLNMENDDEKFQAAFDELVKLRVIEESDKNIYRVYSSEILIKMKDYYSEYSKFPKKLFKARCQKISASSSDNLEKTLLENANLARYNSSIEEVVSSYKEVINRVSSPIELKLEAIINCAAYLFNDRGEYGEAVNLLDDYYDSFYEQPEYIQLFTSFLWSNHNKPKSIRILEEYTQRIYELKSDIDIEIFGVLATKKAIYLVDKRNELKNEYHLPHYAEEWKKQKQDFHMYIERIGAKILDCVQMIDIRNLSSKARQNLFTGVYHTVEVYNRLNKHKEILEYEKLLKSKFDESMYGKLEYKFNRIRQFCRDY